ncbi:hypothetical protein KIV65_gp23 [Mycobacterium phage Anthony]|uniref:Uncharacterized protein n=1 Tax=Mycobacterium phage Anthony TaxID=2599857 RepID=A0A5J6TK96_9CAUD|nr:hypothetical protein KIV65_gp23 [Mycobacterium phage Anthony]QFG10444.1 hypothetical protein PBI_ANTHONY_74 [Mycobacterium phage Anthony]
MRRVTISLAVEIDLDRYILEGRHAGPRSAIQDIRAVAKEVIEHELKKMGYPDAVVSYGKAVSHNLTPDVGRLTD